MNANVKAAAFAAATVLSTATFTQAQEVRLDLTNEYAATSLVGIGDQVFADKVAEFSNGEVQIHLHFGGGLGFRSRDHFDAVGDGAVPLAGTFTGVFTGIDPVFTLSAMPFLTPSVDDAKRMFEIAKPYYENVFAAHNQKLLYATPYTPTGIWARRAIDVGGDLSGLKIRTYDTAGADTFRRIGATPIQLSWGDTVPLLSAGGLDAVLTSDESGISAGLWEYLSHFNSIPYSVAINMTHMNRDVYESLTDAQKAAIDRAAEEAYEANWQRIEERMIKNAEVLEERGVVVIAPSEALLDEFQAAAKEVLEAWLADMGDDGQAILDAYNAGVSN